MEVSKPFPWELASQCLGRRCARFPPVPDGRIQAMLPSRRLPTGGRKRRRRLVSADGKKPPAVDCCFLVIAQVCHRQSIGFDEFGDRLPVGRVDLPRPIEIPHDPLIIRNGPTMAQRGDALDAVLIGIRGVQQSRVDGPVEQAFIADIGSPLLQPLQLPVILLIRVAVAQKQAQRPCVASLGVNAQTVFASG